VAGGYGGILLNARDRLGQLAGLALFYGPDKTMMAATPAKTEKTPTSIGGFAANQGRK